MKPFPKIQQDIGLYLLNKKRFLDQKSKAKFKKIQSIGIVCDARENHHKNQMAGFISKCRKSAKNVFALAYTDQENLETDDHFIYFNDQDLDWKYYPNQSLINQYSDIIFDVVMCFHPNLKMPFEYFAKSMSAGLKIGPPSPKTNCYNFMINEHEIENFLSSAEYLFSRLNVKKHEPAILETV